MYKFTIEEEVEVECAIKNEIKTQEKWVEKFTASSDEDAIHCIYAAKESIDLLNSALEKICTQTS